MQEQVAQVVQQCQTVGLEGFVVGHHHHLVEEGVDRPLQGGQTCEGSLIVTGSEQRGQFGLQFGNLGGCLLYTSRCV